MTQNSMNSMPINEGENIYPNSDDDLEYDDCDEYMDESLSERTDLTNNGNSLNNNAGRGPYERAWTTDATRALIHIRGPLEGRFTEGRQKRTALWLQCTRQLQRMGYRYSAAKVQKKWHNILITYNKNLNKKYLSGYVHWEFFEEMFKYLEGKRANFDNQPQQPKQQPQQLQLQQQQQQQQQQMQFHQNHDQYNQKVQQQQQQQQYPLPKLTVKNYTQTGNQAIGHYVDPQTLLHPHVHLETKSNDEFDEDSASVPDFRQPKIEYDEDNTDPPPSTGPASELQPPPTLSSNEHHMVNNFGHNFADFDNKLEPDTDPSWWKDYFERKLQVEREKVSMQRTMHRDIMQYHKTCLVQQEKIERIKIDAINNLTGALQKLVEAKSRKS